MKLKFYKLITISLFIALVITSSFLILNYIPPKKVQLNLESVSTDTYLDTYLFTTYPYQIQAKITNIDENSLTTGFNIEFYLNDSLLTRIPWFEMGAGNSVKINFTWTPEMEGFYILRTKIVGSNVEVANNDLITSFNVYNKSLNGYQGDLPFATYKTGTINGTVNFSTGNSSYSGAISQNQSYYVSFNLSGLSLQGNVELARIYLYYTWYSGVNPHPDLKIEINDSVSTWAELNLDVGYKDQKGFGSSNYPSGTLCYNVSVISSLTAIYILNVTNRESINTYFYGAGMLIVMNDSVKPRIQYWINEGCDILIARYAAPKNQLGLYPYATSSFIKPISPNPITDATLITVVQGGDGGHNSLTFNGIEWTGLYNMSNIALSSTDVSRAFSNTTNNVVHIIDQWHLSNNGMTPTNAILIVEY